MKKQSIKIGGAVLTFMVLIGFGFLASSGLMYYTYACRHKVLKDGMVYIPTDTTTLYGQAAILFDEGFIKDSSEYKLMVAKMGFKVYPGKYELKEGMTYKQLLSKIGTGSQTPVKVTFNNIRTPQRLAGVVSRYIEADSLSLLNAFLNDSLAQIYGFSTATFPSMFIPNTYELYWNTSPEQFIERMNKEYNRFWSAGGREEKLEKTGLTKQEVSTLASIVIEETKIKEEMPRIAGIYLNRLKAGMPLQADPTVKFALGDPSIKRILYKHLEIESPYNTYKNTGLPPGPIYVPPIVAIDAVLDFEPTDYFYFCAAPDLSGKHVFAWTLNEHNKNAQAYANALNRRGIR